MVGVVRYPLVKRTQAAHAAHELASASESINEKLLGMNPLTVPKEAPGQVAGTLENHDPQRS